MGVASVESASASDRDPSGNKQAMNATIAKVAKIRRDHECINSRLLIDPSSSGPLTYGAVTLAAAEAVASSTTPPLFGSTASSVTLKDQLPGVQPATGK